MLTEDLQSMADIDPDATVSVVCHHCDRSISLTRPDINIRASSIPDTLGCTALTPSQAAAVYETVSTTAADISELNHDITRLQRAIEELLRKRTALQCFANDHKSLFNLVARFPAEVLSQIFQCIVVPWLEGSLYGRFDKTPLMVASVNWHWTLEECRFEHPKTVVAALIFHTKHARPQCGIASL